MLDVIIILLLAYFTYTGYKRGIFLETFFVILYIINLLIAIFLCQKIGPSLDLIIPYPSATEDSTFVFFTEKVGLHLDKPFYIATAFMLILIVGWVIIRIIGSSFNYLKYPMIDVQQNASIGGAVAFLVGLIMIITVLYYLAMIPGEFQNTLQHSLFVDLFMKKINILPNILNGIWKI